MARPDITVLQIIRRLIDLCSLTERPSPGILLCTREEE